LAGDPAFGRPRQVAGFRKVSRRGFWICNFDRQNWKTEWVSRPFRILPDKQAAKHADGRIAFYNGNATTQFIGKLLIYIINTTAPRCI
jgi:hypothetical protein